MLVMCTKLMLTAGSRLAFKAARSPSLVAFWPTGPERAEAIPLGSLGPAGGGSDIVLVGADVDRQQVLLSPVQCCGENHGDGVGCRCLVDDASIRMT